MEVRVVDRDDPDLNAGYFGTDCNAVPRKQFIFFRVKRNVCLGAVRVDMPEIGDRFFHTFLCAIYSGLSVFAKRETDKSKNRICGPL